MSALRESSDVRSIAEEEVERLKTELASKTDALKERDLDVVRLESDLKAARRKSKQPPPEQSGLELQQKLQEAVRKLKDRERSHADLEEELEEKDDKISTLKKESTLAKTAMSMYEKRVDVLEENLKTACKRYDEEVKSRRIVEAAAKKADEHAQSMADKNVELQRELLRRQPEESLYEMEVSIGEKEELRRAQSDLKEERKTVMRLKSAIEDLKKDQTRHSEVLRENRNLKEEDKVATAVKKRSDDDARSSVTLEKIKDELRLANREAAAAKDLQRRSATKLEETEKQVESLKERLNEKGRSTANANKKIASLRDELRAEKEKVATASKERSDGDARRSAIIEKIKEDLRLATRELETAKDRERRSAKKLEESEREVESLKEWLDVTEKNHEANLREFRSSVGSDKAKAISDLETAKADHSDRTDILRSEIADLKEKLAEATRKESSLIKDVEKLTALKDENEKESRRMEKQLSDKDRTAIDLRNEIDTLEEKMKRNGSEIDDQITAYKEEIERNVKRMKELDATIAKKIREAAGLEDEIAVLKEGKERDGRKIKGLGVQLANKGREATALKDEIAALQTDLSRAREECADDRSAELSVLLEKAKDELQRTSRDLAAAKEAEIRLKSNHEKIENEIPQWKQWVEELKKARDESHDSHAKELGSLRDDLEREKSDDETKLATAKISYLTNEIETVNYGRSVEVSKLRRLLNDCRREGSQRQRREPPGRRNVGYSYNVVEDACSGSSACDSEEKVDDDVSEDVLVGNSEENENPRPIPFVVDYRPSSTAYGGLIGEDECSFHQLLNQARRFVESEDEVPEAAKRLSDSSDNFLLLISILLADIVPNCEERERERRELVTSVF
ncbi:myosin-2 heavy chain-like [Anneissia japonica]|uniref:myosin-2 heavy chain-like n=1 Tax=Anneissia japonica TaxID=1529436 RepID=UPI0014259BDD|nr:myosin-2 heavy chain-like [Anneissia japonica]